MSTVLITGANGNLGLTVTARMLADGHRVIAVTGKDGAGPLPDAGNLVHAPLDLLDEEATAHFINETTVKYPDLDAAVLLAGGFAMGKLVSTRKSELEGMLNLNFYTAFHVVRPLLGHFLKAPAGGKFILTGSRPGLSADAGKDFFAYAFSKAMVFKLAEFINAEGRDKGVSATVIAPSTIDTIANRKAMPDADFTKWVPPANIADAVAFALSDTGRMMRDDRMLIYNRS